VTEFDLIERIRARVSTASSVVLGIGDDAAVLAPTPGRHLVATTDSVILDRHFTADWSAADVGHLALAVNLSDLAAMAATPRWTLLALTLPGPDAVWLDGFLDGFLDLARSAGIALVGGNLSSGPLNIGVQALGEVDPGGHVPRTGARPGDWLVVTGTLGDAGAALATGPASDRRLLARLHRPQPRIEAGLELGRTARAMIDLSDGLGADLGHLLSGNLGAEIELAELPTSAALMALQPDPYKRWTGQVNAGGDYELLAVLPPHGLESVQRAWSGRELPLTVIGRVTDRPGIVWRGPDDELIEIDSGGWDHFGTL
jgi:thiamine-monophosphate kinase